MKRIKKVTALSLAAFIALSPIAIKAENLDNVDLISIEEEVEMEGRDYIEFNGKIKKINAEGKSFSILGENDLEEGLNKLIMHIPEHLVLLNVDTMEFMHRDELEVGMEISAFYYKNTPMAMSLPPQLTPDILGVRKGETINSILVDKFDKDLLNSDKSLKLLINDNTEIIDIEGNKVDKEEIEDKALAIFYDIVLESYPAQTGPKKIIVLEGKIPLQEEEKIEEESNQLKVLDKIIINDQEVVLEHPLYKNEEEVFMMPLRQIAEKLEYEVEWDQETWSTSLVKGPHWNRVTIGKDHYNFAKMLIRLGTAPELKDEKTYVPVTFLDEVLRVSTEITEGGVLKIYDNIK